MFAFLQHPAVMLGALFVSLPVHTSGALVVHLQPIAAAVALAVIRIFRENHRKRDEAPAILWPAVQDGIFIQRKLFVADHFLASPVGYGFRKERSHLGEFGQHLEFSQQALGHSDLMGYSFSENFSWRITSLQAPSDTAFGKNAPISASLGSILSFPSRPSGIQI